MMMNEVSPNTLEGSFSIDLVISKIWLIARLARLNASYGNVYVLGSWFGNLGLLMASRNLKFKTLINVDIDPNAMDTSDKITDVLGLRDKIEHLRMDVNDLRYELLDVDGLVINTSCNNIEGDEWFKRIPSGTMVALQSRNQDPNAVNKHRNLSEFCDSYRLSDVFFKGSLPLNEGESTYDRFMMIGRL